MRRTEADTAAFLASAEVEALANLTPAQRKLWGLIEPLGFVLEQTFWGTTKNGGRWPYRVDLYHPGRKLAIEVDGGYHKKTKGSDRRRTNRLRFALGIEVIRVTNNQVLKHHADVVAKIQQAVNAH